MTARSSSFRRIVTAILLAVALPELLGFLSSFAFLVTGESVNPSWVHTARIGAAWIAVIAVFAWFVAGHKGSLAKHFTIVVIVTWLLSELLFAGLGVIISSFIDFEAPIWSFRLQSVGITLLRAFAGLAIGLGIRRWMPRMVVSPRS
jgi:hypothetical protein